MLQAIGIFDLGLCMNGLRVISPIDLNLLMLVAANPLLAIFGLYDLRFLPALAIQGMFIYMLITLPYLLLVKLSMKFLLLSTLW